MVVIPDVRNGITELIAMTAVTTMTSKGQVTVPKRLRDAAGLKPGSRVSFELENGNIVMKPRSKVQKDRFAAVRGTLKTNLSTDQIMALLRGR
jgi:antitoxin PrlF